VTRQPSSFGQVGQSRKRSAVYDIFTNQVPVNIEVDAD
jgi:hypothetical protein